VKLPGVLGSSDSPRFCNVSTDSIDLPLSRIDEAADMAENANTIGVPAWFSGMASVAIYVRGRNLLPELGYLNIFGRQPGAMLLARHHSLMKGGPDLLDDCVLRQQDDTRAVDGRTDV
jgi:hypothetical protein